MQQRLTPLLLFQLVPVTTFVSRILSAVFADWFPDSKNLFPHSLAAYIPAMIPGISTDNISTVHLAVSILFLVA